MYKVITFSSLANSEVIRCSNKIQAQRQMQIEANDLKEELVNDYSCFYCNPFDSDNLPLNLRIHKTGKQIVLKAENAVASVSIVKM